MSSGRPVVVGEVLFDVFPDGARVMGGAPFNVAWHLQALGLQPLLITRVGDDELGREILGEMGDWGMDVRGVQHDSRYPTGRVKVELDGGEPRFEIAAEQAYDYLDPAAEPEAPLAEPAPLIYHGTLIARSEVSREALFAYRGRLAAPVFLDVNLRPPWWREEEIARALLGARWVKLNADELRTLTGLPSADRAELIQTARDFRTRHALEAVIVTLGEDGAFVVWHDELLAGTPPAAVRDGDAVGAGDAFSAAFIAGIVWNWPPATTLSRALDLAAVACALRGAVSRDRTLYERLVDQWGADR
jgi:fructokinase